jgi:hypothetical protein
VTGMRRWQALLVWALLGPTLVLLVQAESFVLVLRGLHVGGISPEFRSWSVLAGSAVLVLVTAAQVATITWRAIAAQRAELAKLRSASDRHALTVITAGQGEAGAGGGSEDARRVLAQPGQCGAVGRGILRM